MASAHSVPKKQRHAISRKAANERLRTAREALEALADLDQESGKHSVAHCAAMVRYWGAKFLEADAKLSEAETPESVKGAAAMLRLASMEAGEWEKRKAGAMASEKVDLLKLVLTRLDEQEKYASELLEIDE